MISSRKGYTFSLQQKLLNGHQFSSGSTPVNDPKLVSTSSTGPERSNTVKPILVASRSLRAAALHWKTGISSHTTESTVEVPKLQIVWLFC